MACAADELCVMSRGRSVRSMICTRKGVTVGLREIARVIGAELTPDVRTGLARVLALIVAASVLSAVTPVAVKLLVDGLAGHRGGRALSPLLLVTLYVAALWLTRVADEVRGLAFAKSEQRIFRTLSERFFSHLLYLPLRHHLDRKTGAVSQTLDNALEGVRIILHQLVFTLVPVAVELGTIMLVLVDLVTPPFLLLFAGAVICYAAAFSYSTASITGMARTASSARVDAAAAMSDGLHNYETVKYFMAEDLVRGRVAQVLRKSEAACVSFYRGYACNGLVLAAIFAAFLAGALVYATVQIQHGRMTLGDFVLINTYMLQVVRPVEMIGHATQGLWHGVAMLEKLVELFREAIEPGERGGNGDGDVTGAGLLEFQAVSASYGGRRVLSEVSFRVAAGQTLGIVGASGSGKSTIVRLLMRLLEPDSGCILLDGTPISGRTLRDVRRSIAVVPQDTVLFDDTLRYNIVLGRGDASAQEIDAAVRMAQLHDFVMSLPEGYETRVGERGVRLSGGERQRVSIARALLKSPSIYVFDEATSSLDSRTEQVILARLRVMARRRTTLVIAHRLSAVAHADEIVVLENGRIAECGPHWALLHQNGRYAALWKAQQEGIAA